MGSPVSRAQTREGRNTPRPRGATPLPPVSWSELSTPWGGGAARLARSAAAEYLYNDADSPDQGVSPCTLLVSMSLLPGGGAGAGEVSPSRERLGPWASGRAWGRAGLPTCPPGRPRSRSHLADNSAWRGHVGHREREAGPASARSSTLQRGATPDGPSARSASQSEGVHASPAPGAYRRSPSRQAHGRRAVVVPRMGTRRTRD